MLKITYDNTKKDLNSRAYSISSVNNDMMEICNILYLLEKINTELGLAKEDSRAMIKSILKDEGMIEDFIEETKNKLSKDFE